MTTLKKIWSDLRDIDMWYHWKAELKWKWAIWCMWTLTGWPTKRRCPQCAGEKVYASESMARYGDDPYPCSMCCGTGLVKRL